MILVLKNICEIRLNQKIWEHLDRKSAKKIVLFSGSASPGFRARGKFLIFYFVAGGSTKSTVSFQEFIFMPPSVVLDGNSELAAHL